MARQNAPVLQSGTKKPGLSVSRTCPEKNVVLKIKHYKTGIRSRQQRPLPEARRSPGVARRILLATDHPFMDCPEQSCHDPEEVK